MFHQNPMLVQLTHISGNGGGALITTTLLLEHVNKEPSRAFKRIEHSNNQLRHTQTSLSIT